MPVPASPRLGARFWGIGVLGAALLIGLVVVIGSRSRENLGSTVLPDTLLGQEWPSPRTPAAGNLIEGTPSTHGDSTPELNQGRDARELRRSEGGLGDGVRNGAFHDGRGREQARVEANANPSTNVDVQPPLPLAQTVTKQQLKRTIEAIPIQVFETAWCPHCRRAKAWFATQPYNVTTYDVDRDAKAKETMKRHNPRGGVPTILVGDRVLVGFSESQVTRTLADIAGEKLGVKVHTVSQ